MELYLYSSMPSWRGQQNLYFCFLLCVAAVIVFLLLLAFFEFYADWYRKSPVCHFSPQSSVFNLMRALFIPFSVLQYMTDTDLYLNFRGTCFVHLHGFYFISTFKMGASVSSSSLVPMQKYTVSYLRTL